MYLSFCIFLAIKPLFLLFYSLHLILSQFDESAPSKTLLWVKMCIADQSATFLRETVSISISNSTALSTKFARDNFVSYLQWEPFTLICATNDLASCCFFHSVQRITDRCILDICRMYGSHWQITKGQNQKSDPEGPLTSVFMILNVEWNLETFDETIQWVVRSGGQSTTS